jgi:GNAT superfamily N-acetyltransferase
MVSRADLAPAYALAREFGDWATRQVREQLGIVIPTDADHPTEVLDELLASGGRLYIAEIDGQPSGIGGLKLLSGSSGEIKRMLVRPTTRQRGDGRAILQQLINDAHELGATPSTSKAHDSCTPPTPSTRAPDSSPATPIQAESSRASTTTTSPCSCASTEATNTTTPSYDAVPQDDAPQQLGGLAFML